MKADRKIYRFKELDSTNVYADKIAADEPDQTLVIAERQTRGKGSKERGWDSRAGCGIWMSLILKPDIEPMNAPKLTLVAALAIARACRKHTGLSVQIKWPNDIVYNGKKLCGILTEMHAEKSYVNHVIVGIGINVNTKSFPAELQNCATSLFLESGRKWNRKRLTAEVLDCFEEDYCSFLRTGDLTGLIEAYREFSATIGKEIKVLDGNGEYTAKALDVNKDGHLVILKEDGSSGTVFADEVSVRGLYGYL